MASTIMHREHSWIPPDHEPLIAVIHLFPDGRWQELQLSRLELEFPTEAEAALWAKHLRGPSREAQDNLELIDCRDSYGDAVRAWQSKMANEVAEADLADIKEDKPITSQTEEDFSDDSGSIGPTPPSVEPVARVLSELSI